jgi:3-oxoacyl-[acyl-carrier protein] reductase
MTQDSASAGRVVIVTGAAAGIGRATALRFGEEGARVAAWDVNEQAATGLAAEIEAAGGQAIVSAVNVARRAEVDAAVAAVVDRWGRVDVLVNNAGIVRDAQLVKWKDGEVALGDERRALRRRHRREPAGRLLLHPRRRAAHDRQGGGVILNASSVVGLYGNFGQTNYAATKAAVINMTRTWSRELGKFGIRVNAVAPGFIATEILKAMPQKVLDGMVAHTPLGRMGEPRDIAEAYVWLASDRASFVHGSPCRSTEGSSSDRRASRGARPDPIGDAMTTLRPASSRRAATCPRSKSATTRSARGSTRSCPSSSTRWSSLPASAAAGYAPEIGPRRTWRCRRAAGDRARRH